MNKQGEYCIEPEHYLITLTNIIDNINDEPHITPEFLRMKLWPGLNQLRNDPQREDLIMDWKYKSDFLSAEDFHQNEQRIFDQLKMEQSYAMFFYICIYH